MIKNNLAIHIRPFKKFIKLLLTKQNNLKRTNNLIHTIINWKIFKSLKLKTYPLSMIICPGNICNLNCQLCPVGLKESGRDKGLMKFSLFKKIIDECGPYLYEIYLYNWGEPLLNKDIFKMISYAKKFNIKTIISSNLMIFDKELKEKLVNSGLDMIIVSLDGASKKSVSKYQKGSDFEKVFGRMNEIIDFRNKERKITPLVSWRFLVNKHNENELEEARCLAKKNKIDEICFIPMLPNMGKYVLRTEEESFGDLERWIPLEDTYSYFNKKTGKFKESNPPCNWMWLSASVNWDGSVSPCCGIWHKKFDFGDVSKDSFIKIWNNKNYANSRKIIINKKINEFNICNICKKNNKQINLF
ncbi:MAG: radical SAM protein [Nanoarchaeota archaeon]